MNVDIQIVPRSGPLNPPPTSISILGTDVNRTIARSNKIRILATAGDSESGVGSIALATNTGTDGQGISKVYDLSWACSTQPPPAGLELDTMVPSSPLGTIAPPKALTSIDVTVDPVAQTATCAGGTAALGGFVRLVATNGKGAATASNTFSFNFP